MKELPTITFIANLTYSLYLFHMYLWKYLIACLQKINFNLLPIKAQALIALFIFWYLTHRMVEQYGIKLGKRAISYYRKWIYKEKLYGQPISIVNSSS
jgi:peptidoglycan/LPS O-acetylase OafA/YrhL